MTEADRDTVGLVGFRAWKSSNAFDDVYLDPIVIERVRGEFEKFAKETTCDVVIAEVSGLLVGWGARADEPDYISDIWVDPDWQGKGVGGILVAHCLQQIRNAGVEKARIATHAKNFNAIRLYERCGFRIVWQGLHWSETMRVELEKVRMEMALV